MRETQCFKGESEHPRATVTHYYPLSLSPVARRACARASVVERKQQSKWKERSSGRASDQVRDVMMPTHTHTPTLTHASLHRNASWKERICGSSPFLARLTSRVEESLSLARIPSHSLAVWSVSLAIHASLAYTRTLSLSLSLVIQSYARHQHATRVPASLPAWMHGRREANTIADSRASTRNAPVFLPEMQSHTRILKEKQVHTLLR